MIGVCVHCVCECVCVACVYVCVCVCVCVHVCVCVCVCVCQHLAYPKAHILTVSSDTMRATVKKRQWIFVCCVCECIYSM